MGHRLPVRRAGCAEMEYVRVRDLVINDQVYVASNWNGKEFTNLNVEGSAAALAVVHTIEMERTQGIFAPFTEEGTILVDGVVASCYALGQLSHGQCHQGLAPVRAMLLNMPAPKGTDASQRASNDFRRPLSPLMPSLVESPTSQVISASGFVHQPRTCAHEATVAKRKRSDWNAFFPD